MGEQRLRFPEDFPTPEEFAADIRRGVIAVAVLTLIAATIVVFVVVAALQVLGWL